MNFSSRKIALLSPTQERRIVEEKVYSDFLLLMGIEVEFPLLLTFTVGGILLLLASIWAWTSVKVKSMDFQSSSTISAAQSEREITVETIRLQGTQQTNSTNESIALLQDKTERERLLLDKEYKERSLALEEKALGVQLDTERMRQEGSTLRAQLTLENARGIAEMEISHKDRELSSSVEMFSKNIDYKYARLKQGGELGLTALQLQRDGIEARERSSKYLADRAFEGIELAQRHEDGRHSLSLDTQRSMHRESMGTKRELGLAAIASHEKVQLKGFETRRFEAEQATVQRRIEAESSGNLISAVLGTAVSFATKGISGPMGGGSLSSGRALEAPGEGTKRIKPL